MIKTEKRMRKKTKENNQVTGDEAVDYFCVLIQYERTLAESLDEDIKQTLWTVDEKLMYTQGDVYVRCDNCSMYPSRYFFSFAFHSSLEALVTGCLSPSSTCNFFLKLALTLTLLVVSPLALFLLPPLSSLSHLPVRLCHCYYCSLQSWQELAGFLAVFVFKIASNL